MYQPENQKSCRFITFQSIRLTLVPVIRLSKSAIGSLALT